MNRAAAKEAAPISRTPQAGDTITAVPEIPAGAAADGASGPAVRPAQPRLNASLDEVRDSGNDAELTALCEKIHR